MNRAVVDLDGVGFVDHAVYRILGGDDDGQAVAGLYCIPGCVQIDVVVVVFAFL